jgi:hypothetical protein
MNSPTDNVPPKQRVGGSSPSGRATFASTILKSFEPELQSRLNQAVAKFRPTSAIIVKGVFERGFGVR